MRIAVPSRWDLPLFALILLVVRIVFLVGALDPSQEPVMAVLGEADLPHPEDGE